MVYLVGDLKLFDEDYLKDHSIVAYHKQIIENWNNTVKNPEEDWVLLIGDLWGVAQITEDDYKTAKEVVSQLCGRKIVMSFKGSDKEKTQLKTIFDAVYETDGFLKTEDSEWIIITTNQKIGRGDEYVNKVMPESSAGFKGFYKDKVLSISNKKYEFYPIDYDALPFFIREAKLLEDDIGGEGLDD